MSKPLLISDCDEVLLHMIGHFAEWIAEEHGMHFALETPDFHEAVTWQANGEVVPSDRLWHLLDLFFESEMHRQNVVPGAVEALAKLSHVADVVILTNIGDEYQASRVRQLETFDIRHRVLCNRGGKGRPVKELLTDLRPSVTVFVDDLAVHHRSVAEEAPGVWRLHMIAEPRVAAHMPPAPYAHTRIDRWEEATGWIMDRFAGGVAAE